MIEKIVKKKKSENFFFQFRYFLRKFPFIVKIKKIILLKLFLNLNFLYKFIVNNKIKTFDNQKKEIELLAINNFNEKYIVNSNDKGIGRLLYINGSYEFDIFYIH